MGKELFKNIPSKVGDLVKDVRNGRIGLPDLQRPFVWRDNKVRELFDSMLKGYPIGYIMLWESPADYESKKSTIGDNSKTYEEPKAVSYTHLAFLSSGLLYEDALHHNCVFVGRDAEGVPRFANQRGTYLSLIHI